MDAITDPVVKVEPEVSEFEGIPAYNPAIAPSSLLDTSVTASKVVPKSEPDISETDGKDESSLSLTDRLAVPMAAIKKEADRMTMRVLDMGGGDEGQKLKRMAVQGRSILTLCRRSKASITPDRTEEMINRFADARLYLDWLDTNVEMTPRINSVAKVDLVLGELIKPENKVPSELVKKAEELFTKYKVDNWGQDNVAEGDAIVSDGQSVSTATVTIGEIQIPADSDPIFGRQGIMYGIVVDRNGSNRSYRIRADIPRKSPKVYGDNGIPLGAWYPLQISALFWGAHGSRIGGIAGSVTTGAWSIVVAGTYEDLDTDNGNTLYYSGSNSHENTNPREPAPASQGTKALYASYRTQNPVRVLRSGGSYNSRNQNPHLPSCGMRYDGLYRVVSSRVRLNKKGGQYEQFKLERLPNQTPLSELERNIPTTEQVNAREQL